MQDILRGASISASGTALSLVVNLLIVTILVREYGVEAAGIVGLCNVFTAMDLLGVFDFGAHRRLFLRGRLSHSVRCFAICGRLSSFLFTS